MMQEGIDFRCVDPPLSVHTLSYAIHLESILNGEQDSEEIKEGLERRLGSWYDSDPDIADRMFNNRLWYIEDEDALFDLQLELHPEWLIYYVQEMGLVKARRLVAGGGYEFGDIRFIFYENGEFFWHDEPTFRIRVRSEEPTDSEPDSKTMALTESSDWSDSSTVGLSEDSDS
jgi:hypothetical protein